MFKAPTDVNQEQRTQSVITLTLSIAKALVDDPQGVAVTCCRDDELGTTILLTVAPADLDKIIGKQGRAARSMRRVLQAASAQLGRTFSLDIQAAAD